MRDDILTVFEKQIKPAAADRNAILGENLDGLFGFSPLSVALDPSANFQRAQRESWRLDPSSYTSTIEYRLQVLCESILIFANDIMKTQDLPSPDSICVRIVELEHSSPYRCSASGYQYILIPSGFLKSLENTWRVHFALVSEGTKLPAEQALIKSNRVGGAMVELALTRTFRERTTELLSIFIDAGWQTIGGSMFYPEEIQRAMARMGLEVLNGLYSTEGRLDTEFRPPGTLKSQWLSRLVLAYLASHEMAHVIFAHEGIGDEPCSKEDSEVLCDLFATYYYPYFVAHDSRTWEITRDGSTEHVAGIFGFFATIEIRLLVDLILGVLQRRIAEGDAAYNELSNRISAFQRRAIAQVKVLQNLSSKDLELSSFTDTLLAEFRALLVGVQMVGSRLLLSRQSSFASHFKDWQDRSGIA